MTPREISHAVTTYFLAAPMDDQRLTFTAERSVSRGLDKDLVDDQARTLAEAVARNCLSEAGIDEESPHWDALSQAAVRAVVDGEPSELPPVPGVVWGHERQLAIGRAVVATSKLTTARLIHRAAWELREKLLAERCDDAGFLATAANGARQAALKEKEAERFQLAALRSLDAEELQAGLVQVSRPNPLLQGEKAHQAYKVAIVPWQQVLEWAEADPQNAGGPADRTALMNLLQDDVTEHEEALSRARAKRDEVIKQSIGTTNYRVSVGTGLSKPAVKKIRPGDNAKVTTESS